LLDDRTDDRAVANIIWATAKLWPRASVLKRLLPPLADLAIWVAGGLSPRDASNIMWSAATLRKVAPQLAEEVAPELMEPLLHRAEEAVPQDVSNVLWALAVLQPRLQGPIRRVAHALLDAMQRKLDSATPQAIANTIWALGVLDIAGPQTNAFLKSALQCASTKIPAFDAQGLANLCQGLALCSHSDASFMARVSRAVVQPSPCWKKDANILLDLPDYLWAFATLKIHDDGMMATCVEELFPCVGKLNDCSVCMLAWSLQRLHPEANQGRFERAVRAEVARRSLEQSDIEHSSAGPHRWADKQQIKRHHQ